MGKLLVGIIAGLLVWLAAVLVAGVLLRWLWPEYVVASGNMSFTLPMKLTRLSIGALATVAAGAAASFARPSSRTAVITGALLLVFFIPEHISLWNQFPVWYHLTFLTSLVPLAVVGGRIAGRRRPE